MPNHTHENQTVTDPMELCKLLKLNPQDYITKEQLSFPLRVPKSFVARMTPGNPNDPLLLQVIPRKEEAMRGVSGFTADPVGDMQSIVGNGVIQKYKSRVLLITTGACTIHCRYCFRRHFPYSGNSIGSESLNSALQHIHDDSSLSEVILSGGDPLSLTDHKLFFICHALSQIQHIKRIRIHTRYPIVRPNRIDKPFLTEAEKLNNKLVIVFHVNHANELDTSVINMLAGLKRLNIPLLNQTVLLRGINDETSTLITLSEALFAAGILPYYIHILDKVNGAHHFEVAESKILTLISTLQHSLPGYLVPKFVKDLPGSGAKTLVL